jgi:ATP-dependent protease Clp ATPase subunit
METLMMPLMYDTPSQNDVAGLLITPECVTQKAPPLYTKKEPILLENSTAGLIE